MANLLLFVIGCRRGMPFPVVFHNRCVSVPVGLRQGWTRSPRPQGNGTPGKFNRRPQIVTELCTETTGNLRKGDYAGSNDLPPIYLG